MKRWFLLATLLGALAGGAAAAPRPKIGLVLGGGGARGAAHIGVLQTLERLRVPVDCVAGTSFGALVGGAWAAGVGTEEMRRAMAGADWDAMFQDSPDYTQLAFRQKRLQQRYLPASEAGVDADGVRYPPGAVSGQRIQLFIHELLHAERGEQRIERLPLPLSIVATDLASGERVVFRDGALALAMRASMAVPGLVTPLDLDGRKLVDGGLVDNLPVAEVRERCGAEVVIAVNVGSPLLSAPEIGSLLSVSAQMVLLLTEQNVTRSLQGLGPNDIYLRPQLDGISAADFERHAEAARRGAQAAELVAYALRPLALDEGAWLAWTQARRGARETAPRVDAIEVAGTSEATAAVVARHLSQRSGQALDTGRLTEDLMRAYGDGWTERIDYRLVTEPEAGTGSAAAASTDDAAPRLRHILRVLPVLKSWGPDYLRFALNLDSTLNQGSTFSLRAALHRTRINTLGGELLFSAEAGHRSALELQWWQPLDAAQRWFGQLDASVGSVPRDLFVGQRHLARYDVELATLALSAGWDMQRLGQLRLGLQATDGGAHLEIGPPLVPAPLLKRRSSGTLLSLDLDQLNRLYFPTDGWALRALWYRDHDGSYSRLNAEARAAVSVGAWVFGARAAFTGSPTGELPLFEAGTLGGFLNLSAYASGQFVADTVRYAHLRAERIIGRLPLGLRGDMRLGLAIEGARLGTPYVVTAAHRRLGSLAIYLGGETPFGPVYLGLGHSKAGAANAYLFLGTP